MNEQSKISTEDAKAVLPTIGHCKLDVLLDSLERDSWALWDLWGGLRGETVRAARVNLIRRRLQRSIDQLDAVYEKAND